MGNITERHRQTLLRQARKYIADLEAKPPAKNKAGASRRQSCINRAKRLIACLEAGGSSVTVAYVHGGRETPGHFRIM